MAGEEKMVMAVIGVAMMMAVLQMVLQPAEPAKGLVLWITPLTGPPTGGTSAQTAVIDVYDGERYLCGTSVTNLSTKAGAPVAATLKTQIVITINGTIIADTGKLSASFAASETKEFQVEFTVPAGASVGVGVDNAEGFVYDPSGNVLAQASLSLNVLQHPVLQCLLSVSASPSSGGSVRRSPSKSLYDDGEMIDVTATTYSGWSFDKFTGDGWVTSANPVHVRGCMTTSVTAHFVEVAPPPPVLRHHYLVTYLNGTTRIISWVPDPVSKPNLWDFVNRDELLSWTYLGLY